MIPTIAGLMAGAFCYLILPNLNHAMNLAQESTFILIVVLATALASTLLPKKIKKLDDFTDILTLFS